ncbi:peptide chain release factor N(5)-glutamine methyltransferase [Microbacterium sp. STN6]|uniref:peptide chain release factor N(5)-glutamine methyltransferase n=1 Tax=Microbacterium sp. STN6 TaxID=2995588 RepID=UPI002260F34B|nr:peptide chain release factor N(5)-glutamine methyltransferase [Microbacterium sp. STN6]MCX7521165.1 peptide chain release factor N(5)-glutamine methyltransferase [Microbacterium sp. STN6]
MTPPDSDASARPGTPESRDSSESTHTARAPQTVRELRACARDRLAAAGILEAETDAELLIGHVLGVSRGRVQSLVVTDSGVEPGHAASVASLVERRARREPLQHITGIAPFRALELRVGPGVFVPRPETELVAQFAIDALAGTMTDAGAPPIAVDLGTGSGAIAIALATEVPHANVYAVEKSAEAYAWARRNVDELAGGNLTLVHGDLADALGELDGRVDVVVSNPPYVPRDAVPVDPEVRLFDPELALYGGDDGLDVVRALSVTALRLLHPGGLLVLEHGELQGRAIRELLSADGWRAAATHPDLTTRDRITTALR